MIVRKFNPEQDGKQLEEIHGSYESELGLQELVGERFVIADDNDRIIVVGCNCSLAEVRLVTNKNVNVKQRREALMSSFQISEFVAKNAGYNQLHAFVQDEVWLNQLLKHGFRRTTGTAILIDI